MKRYVLPVIFFFWFCGCAWNYEFGRSSDPTPKGKYIGTFERARPGMTQKEIEEAIGTPAKRNFDVQFMGQNYDEAWVYDSQPPTILYFRGKILKHKEYQQ